MSDKPKVSKTRVLYDDRYVKYKNVFMESKVVHQPLLRNYLEIIIREFKEENDDGVLHIVVYDHKSEEDNVKYLDGSIDVLNDESVVLHVINPKAIHNLPRSPMIHYYLPLEKGIQKKVETMHNKISIFGDEEKYNIILVEDVRSITLNIGDN